MRLCLAPQLGVVIGVLMLGLTGWGCSKGTYLVVNFKAGSTLPDIYGIRVALTLSPESGPTRQSIDTLPSLVNTSVLPLPTSAAFKLNDDAGVLDIAADALNLEKKSVARGTIRTTIQHAQTWNVTMTFGSAQALSAQTLELEPDPSSGVDVDVDAEVDGRAQEPTWAPLRP